MQKLCEICGIEAMYFSTPDLDIQGLGACEEHRELMREACLILMSMSEKDYHDFINQHQVSPRKKRNKKKQT